VSTTIVPDELVNRAAAEQSPGVPTGDWIGTSEACRLVPSPRPGKATALSILYRWMKAGTLPFARRGRWRFVRRWSCPLLGRRRQGNSGAIALPARPAPRRC
jgi:hypothetical protein